MVLKMTGMVEALSAPAGPFTLFAPVDNAFDSLPDRLRDCLTMEELSEILLYHVVDGEEIFSDELMNGKHMIRTMGGSLLTVEKSDGDIKINGANLIAVD